MATATIEFDLNVYAAGAEHGATLMRQAIVDHVTAAAETTRAERDALFAQGDSMGDHMHIARSVESIERLRDEVASAPLPTRPSATAASAINLAVAEVEALAADYAARADGASPAQEEIMRAFAANLRHLAARIRALPHLARGGTP